MAKIRHSVDKLMARAAEEYVENALDKKLNGDDLNLDPSALPAFPPESLQEDETTHPAVDDFLLRAKEDGHYFKLYKETVEGRNEFMGNIERPDYENWSDIEADLCNLVKNKTRSYFPKAWGSGKYTLRMYRRGGGLKGSFTNIYSFNCAEEEDFALQRVNNPKIESAKEKIAETTELIRAVKDISGKEQSAPSNQSNFAEVLRVLNDVQKSATDTILKTMPQPPQQTNIIQIIAALLPIFKELGLIGQPKVDPQQMVRETIGMLKDMGVIGQPKQQEDFVSQYLKMKELGLIKDKDEDTIGMVEKITKIVEAVGNLTGGGNNSGPVSLGVEIVKNLAPHVPTVIEKVTGAVHDVAEVQKLRIMRSMDMPAASSQPTVDTRPTEALPAPTKQPTGGDMPFFMHPLLKELYTIIQIKDTTKYRHIAEKIMQSIPQGDMLIQSIAVGETTAEQMQQTLVGLGGKPFADAITFEYIKGWVAWLQTPPQTSEPIPAESAESNSNSTEVFIVRCNKCNEEYDYPDKVSFESDPNKVCGLELGDGLICDGVLVSKTGNGKADHYVEDKLDEANLLN